MHLIFFFFNDTATTEIYTLSLHDALPISPGNEIPIERELNERLSHAPLPDSDGSSAARDRKSTRLNSSHSQISYAVFCLKKKWSCPRLDRSSSRRSSLTTEPPASST